MGSDWREAVSIIMPFFEAGEFLGEAIDSVLAQEGAVPWRLYLIQDGDSRRDLEIAREFAWAQPERIHLLENPGGRRNGSSASRNRGVRSSSGEIVAFLDADDVWTPRALATLKALLDRNQEARMCYGSALRWFSWNGGSDFEVPPAIAGYGAGGLAPGEAVLETFLHDESQTPCTGSVAVRRCAFDAVGGFEEQFDGLFDDQALYAKLCLSGPVYISHECFSRYRRHPRSCCSQAETNGTSVVERARFLDWLSAYRKMLV